MFSAQSCSEKIDEGNFAIAKEQTINDYLGTSKEFLHKSNLSSIVFVWVTKTMLPRWQLFFLLVVTIPSLHRPNEAMAAYVTKVLGESKSIADLTDEQAQLIAYSCVIDNGNESAYDSPLFPTKGGAFAKGDLNDRSITCEEVSDSLKKP